MVPDNLVTAEAPVVKREPQEPPPLDRVLSSAVRSLTVKTESVQPLLAPRILSEPAAPPPDPNVLLPNPSAKIEAQNRVESKPEIKPDFRVPSPPREYYTTYCSADEINYTPEAALAEGIQMARTLEDHLRELDLGTELRRTVWSRDIESFKSQSGPRTMIAVCGATGAGKSSLLNAILDSNLVPTSGMRACTAVVTEIGYHDKDTIVAEVEFLALSEWKAELEILLDDLVEANGKLKNVTNLRSDAGIAWHKIRAVYPGLKAELMVTMTLDAIIESNLEIAHVFGTTETIECQNAEEFGLVSTRYIDSKDRKGGRGKRKKGNEENPKPEEAALWPLIRSVRIRVKSKVLSSGAVLVDLPGVADANLARNNIAKEYMKKCDCIWIAAPITRALDDKTAKDLLGEAFKTQLMNGNYDANIITFIATKTDDLSCKETIESLSLGDDEEEFEKIQSKIADAHSAVVEWTAVAKVATEDMQNTSKQIEHLEAVLEQCKARLENFKALNQPSPVIATPSAAKNPGFGESNCWTDGRGVKRARIDGNNEALDPNDISMDLDNIGDPTNCNDNKEGDTDAEDAMVEDVLNRGDVIEIDSDNDEPEVIDLSYSDDPETTKDELMTASEDMPATLARGESMVDTILAVQTRLKADIEKAEAEVKELKMKLDQQTKARANAEANANECRREGSNLQKTKNSYCSRKRNEHSKVSLKGDFRLGLKEFDQANEEAKNPETFDHTKDLRDYDAINLPVFTCSARDYIRIKKQVKEDGEPTCFIDPEETEIPILQEWCHHLTSSARERSARSLLKNLVTFLSSVKSFVDKMEGVNVSDRLALGNLWGPLATARTIEQNGMLGLTQAQPNRSPVPVDSPPVKRGRRSSKQDEPPLAPDNSLSGLAQRAQRVLECKHKAFQPGGKSISALLHQNMKKVATDCVANLKRAFRDGIAECCQSGANKARLAAVQTCDSFAVKDRMPWQSYRALLHHDGEYKHHDLNAALADPMGREIAISWAQLFDSDLFAPTLQAEQTEITGILQQIEASALPDLKARCQAQCQLALNEAQVLTANIIQNIKTVLTEEQKSISRCLTPHVQKELSAAYAAARDEQGPGCMVRKKKMIHDHVEKCCQTMFSNGTNTLFSKLDHAAELIGTLLEAAFSELADKVEVNISVLWDIPRVNVEQRRKRRELSSKIHTMQLQLQLWVAASRMGTD